MKKIISLFQRNYETDRLVRNEVEPFPDARRVIVGRGSLIDAQKIEKLPRSEK